jgi:hypothetical protein
MIRRRKQKLFNASGRKLEYFLESMNEWLTPAEMTRLPGCNIKAESIKGRISNKASNPEFVTLEGCIFTPKKVGNGLLRGELIESKSKRDSENSDIEYNTWMQLHHVWPVLKDTNLKPLIMQSRPVR